MEYRVTPWAHQLKAINLAKGRDSFALFFEQGTGKTSTCINILRHLYQDSVTDRCLRRTLILCPQIVIENWRREFEQHSFLQPARIHTLTGSGGKRLQKICDLNHTRSIFITNYEALQMEPVFNALKAWRPEVMVLDESHKCKSMGAKRTKRAIKLAEGTTHRYILSGTPIVNNIEDIFSQFLFLDGGRTFGTRFLDFRREYFTDRNANRPRQSYFPDWVPKPETPDRINELVYKNALRVRKSECLDLPEFVRQFVSVDLSPEQRRVYRDIEKDAVAVLEKNIVSADLAIKKALRLQQVVTGYVKTDEDTIRTFTPNPRIEALRECIEQIGHDHKIIVWAVFKQNYADIRALLERLKISHVEIHGDIPANERQGYVDAFNDRRSPVRVLLAHPASAGTGVNLTGASYSIFYSRGFSLEHDLQAEARNYRGGSEIHEKITRIDIVANGTIDEVVLAALADKADISERILKHIKEIR